MNKKWIPVLFVILLGIVFYLVKNYSGDGGPDSATTERRKESTDPATNPNRRDRGFDRRVSFLKYSQHATCRMQCRRISESEVEEIMLEGKINYRKSDLDNVRCPRYALEGVTDDRQRVRIVFAQCKESTTVVTVIDLDREWQCDCPGDDDKYKNRN